MSICPRYLCAKLLYLSFATGPVKIFRIEGGNTFSVIYFEKKEIDVLVENKIKDQEKYFGRNEYFNPVIIDGNKKDIGKIVKVNIENSNQNTLFGKIMNKMKAA